MFSAPKVFKYLSCAVCWFVFVCVARDTVLSAKMKHIILQYVQRNSKDMRNNLMPNVSDSLCFSPRHIQFLR